ncbi:MAG: SCO family protein [Oceanococcaceae bacterium]
MRRPYLTRLLLIGLGIVIAAGLFMPRMNAGKDLQGGLLLDTPRPLKGFGAPLLTETGADYQLEDFRGKHHLLFFGFAACPDICPNTLQMAGQMYDQLSPAERAKLDVVFVSVDPERDTPDMLQQYVRSFHPDFHALTGPDSAIESLAEQAGIAYIKVPTGETYTIDHSAALVLLDDQARIRAYFAPPLRRDVLAADLSTLLGS